MCPDVCAFIPHSSYDAALTCAHWCFGASVWNFPYFTVRSCLVCEYFLTIFLSLFSESGRGEIREGWVTLRVVTVTRVVML